MSDRNVFANGAPIVPTRFQNFEPNTTVAVYQAIAAKKEAQKEERRTVNRTRQALGVPTPKNSETCNQRVHGSSLGTIPTKENVWQPKSNSLDDLIREEMRRGRESVE